MTRPFARVTHVEVLKVTRLSSDYLEGDGDCSPGNQSEGLREDRLPDSRAGRACVASSLG